jgi:hypothetical protein
MNTRPTPETDAFVEDCAFNPRVHQCLNFARKIERERGSLHDLHNKNAAHFNELLEHSKTLSTERDGWEQLAIQYSAEREHNAMQSLIYKAERDEARGQRDRLAEALRMITTFDYTDLQCDNGHGARFVATEALQSLTTNEP